MKEAIEKLIQSTVEDIKDLKDKMEEYGDDLAEDTWNEIEFEIEMNEGFKGKLEKILKEA